jgi:hypothetical protein
LLLFVLYFHIITMSTNDSSKYVTCEYMPYVTNNVNTFVTGENNLVACVYCIEIYETKTVGNYHNCLFCHKCNVDALMVVEHSPLKGMAEEEQKALLTKWHIEGFTPIPRNRQPRGL